MKISEHLKRKLVCPSTKERLLQHDNYLESAVNPTTRYPIVEGIPVLIADEKSLFSINDFINKRNTTFNLQESTIKKRIKAFLPTISANIKAKDNYNALVSLLSEDAKILVIGGSIRGNGMEAIYTHKSFEIVGSDVSFGPDTTIISDAHDIPFEDNTFDCVVIQAVLEHVLDPRRCVEEAYRALKPDGLIYAETPFMQQVHGQPHDFTRFSYLGHRWLFRNFENIMSGPCCGPGMALAWSYRGFFRSLASSRAMLAVFTAFAYMTSFFLKYFDYYLIDKPGAYEAASAYYFLGRKTKTSLSPRALLKEFKGYRRNL